VIKRSKIRRPAVQQPVSRIRREPVQAQVADRPRRGWLSNVDFHSREWEIGLALAGIVLFALAINAMVFDLGEFLSH
jgi:hypothetical protein